MRKWLAQSQRTASRPMAHILLIAPQQVRLDSKLRHLGHQVQVAADVAAGLAAMQRFPADLVVVPAADAANGGGADRFLLLPVPPEVLQLNGESADEAVALVQATTERMGQFNAQFSPDSGIIGSSPELQECLQIAAMAAGTDSAVLIGGETGTGKELFARAIHDRSPRAKRDFVVVDCAALPPTLVESVLFGYRRGSFTGADNPNEGLIKAADGGTLFLDEVGELPLDAQKAFLRILQERRFRPIGSQTEIRSDFRLIAATNRSLEDMCAAGTFRSDLMFRLRSLTIDLPPLRSRPGDIAELVDYHVTRICQRFGLPPRPVSEEVLHYLRAYDWPGNVRELVNTLDGAVTISRFDHALLPQHLPKHIRLHLAKASEDRQRRQIDPPAARAFPTLKEFRRQAVDAAERSYLQDLMHQCQGDISSACRMSGLSRSRLYDLLKTHDVE